MGRWGSAAPRVHNDDNESKKKTDVNERQGGGSPEKISQPARRPERKEENKEITLGNFDDCISPIYSPNLSEGGWVGG